MALFIDRRGASPVTSKLRQVFPLTVPDVVDSNCPIYVLDDESSDSDGSSTFYDSDDDVFLEAVEEQPPPSKAVRLPEEVLDAVFARSQDEYEDQGTLRTASLVCRDWSVPARRLLFSQCLSITNHDAVKRLRDVLDARPELARATKRIDLSNPGSAWQDGRIGEIFRRAAGLMRQTKNVQEVHLLHIALTDKIRRKLFGALKSLPIRTAYLYSSSWSSWSRNSGLRRASSANPDMDELAHLLCTWRTLKSLTLSGYSSYPRLLSGACMPVHALPTYRLTDLTIISVDLTNSTLLWLLGSSGSSLKRLNLAATSGLTASLLSHLFTLVGPTLEVLLLSLDIDDLHPSTSADVLDNAILAPLTALKTFNLSTDSVFADSVVETLVALPSIESISLCFPGFSHPIVLRAVQSVPVPTPPPPEGAGGEKKRSGLLSSLVLDAWETNTMWEESERFELLCAGEARGITLSLNGLVKEDIEEEWYGEDVSGDWSLLERPDQPRRGSRVRPIWR
ncbi:hypothetical protein JCM6882_004024 [Rhodosporidiobolus microsporus]